MVARFRYPGRHRWPGTVLFVVLCVLSGSADVRAQDSADRYELGYPGYLIISSARDSTSGFTWQSGPAPDGRSLIWETGMLSVPDTLPVEPFAAADLAVPVGPHLAGGGSQGRLLFRDGDYEIDEPVLLTDGVVSFQTSAGSLEIRGQRIRYRPPTATDAVDPRANYLMLAGVLLLVVILLRRARRLTRRGP